MNAKSDEIDFVNPDPDIKIQLIKITDGKRIIRLEKSACRLVLQQELDPKLPVRAQKNRLVAAFEAALTYIEREP